MCALQYFRFLTTAVLCLHVSLANAQPKAKPNDERLGSTLTFEQLESKNFGHAVANRNPLAEVVCDSALQATPAFKVRLWPNILEGKPGSAYMHFSRALVLYAQTDDKVLRDWNVFLVANEEDISRKESAAIHLEKFKNVFEELERFSRAEDLSWDHRFRDLRGAKVYEYLLPEVQSARDLARLLKYRAVEQIRARKFAEAVGSMRVGFQLGRFLRNGETLVQQLVGIAIEGMMLDAVLEAISTPGCPNLYWALAAVPREPSMRKSIEIETSMIPRILQVLEDPERQDCTQAAWQAKWKESIGELNRLIATDSSSNKLELSLIVASELSAHTKEKRAALVEFGLERAQVEAMCPEQVLAVHTRNEIDRIAQQVFRTSCLPYSDAKALIIRDDEMLNRLHRSSIDNKVVNPIVSGFFPALSAVRNAEIRAQASYHRLLVLEAIRDYAASHDQKLPSSLDAIVDLPVLRDPFTDKPMTYRVQEKDGKQVGVLEIPEMNEHNRRLEFQFR
jgi:hypothetical protein